MALYVRELEEGEEKQLREWQAGEDRELKHRATVVLLSRQGYRVPEISRRVQAHPTNLRKWIHRFNQCGVRGLITPRSGGPAPRFTAEQKAQIVALSQKGPRELRLPFSRWTLHKLAEQAVKQGIVPTISHEYVRQILKEAKSDYRNSQVA